jgi:hypothetical protein
VRQDLEFQPGATGEFHFSRAATACAGLHVLDTPTIHGVATDTFDGGTMSDGIAATVTTRVSTNRFPNRAPPHPRGAPADERASDHRVWANPASSLRNALAMASRTPIGRKENKRGVRNGTSIRSLRLSYQAAHPPAVPHEQWQQSASHLSRRPGDENKRISSMHQQGYDGSAGPWKTTRRSTPTQERMQRSSSSVRIRHVAPCANEGTCTVG